MNASNDDSTRRRWHRRRWLVGLILVTTFLVLAAWIGGPPDAALDRLLAISGAVAGSAPAEPEIGRVEVSVFRTGELEPPLVFEQYRGEVHARRTSSLAMRRSGRLTDVRVHEGDRVNRGDVLAALDVSDLDVQQSLADAEVAAAAAALDEAVAGPREQTVQAAAARVRQLTAQLNSARRRLERQEKLRLKNAGADQELDDARYSVDELRATLAATQAQFDELAEGTRVEQIAAAKAKLAAAEAARQQIDVDRRDSRIVAPFAGVIALRNFDEGEIVGPNQAVFRILEHDPLHDSFGVPPDLAGDWKVGDRFWISTQSHSLHPETPSPTRPSAGFRPASIVRMQPQVDPITRTRGIELELESAARADSIHIGQTATLWVPWKSDNYDAGSDLLSRTLSGSFWIPAESLVRGTRGLWSVYVAVADPSAGTVSTVADRDANVSFAIIERREIQIDHTIGPLVLVHGMLLPGEWIVGEGTGRIGPGVAVIVNRPGAPWDAASVSSAAGLRR